jgi:short-subunit dehydrogenase
MARRSHLKIAIITGASAGLGTEFVKRISIYYPDVEELWLIARREDKLREAAELTHIPCRIVPLDLTRDESYNTLSELLESENADVRLLVNNSGCGYLGNVGEGELSRHTRTVDLNVRGLTAVTHVAIPHMTKGSAIINVSSIASFCPNPRMTTYSSTKAYVTSFTFGIAEELRPLGITATAVCSGPMDTDFIYLGEIRGQSKTFETLPYCDPAKVAEGALRAAKKGRTVHTPRAFYKLYRVLAKILPTKLMIKFAKT